MQKTQKFWHLWGLWGVHTFVFFFEPAKEFAIFYIHHLAKHWQAQKKHTPIMTKPWQAQQKATKTKVLASMGGQGGA